VTDPARVFLAEGKRTQGLGQQRQLRGAQRDLAGPGLEERALDTDEIAEIEKREDFVRRAEIVDLEVDLDLPELVGEVRKGGLAVGAQRPASRCTVGSSSLL